MSAEHFKQFAQGVTSKDGWWWRKYSQQLALDLRDESPKRQRRHQDKQQTEAVLALLRTEATFVSSIPDELLVRTYARLLGEVRAAGKDGGKMARPLFREKQTTWQHPSPLPGAACCYGPEACDSGHWRPSLAAVLRRGEPWMLRAFTTNVRFCQWVLCRLDLSRDGRRRLAQQPWYEPVGDPEFRPDPPLEQLLLDLAQAALRQRDYLVESNLPLVISRVRDFRKKTSHGVRSPMDQVLFATEGFVRGIDRLVLREVLPDRQMAQWGGSPKAKFVKWPRRPRPGKEAADPVVRQTVAKTFRTVAVGCLSAALQDYYNQTVLAMSSADKGLLYRINKQSRRAFGAEGATGTNYEWLAGRVAPDRAGVTASYVAHLVAAAGPVGMEQQRGDRFEAPRARVVAAPDDQRPDERAEAAERLRDLAAAFARLSVAERKLLRLSGMAPEMNA